MSTGLAGLVLAQRDAGQPGQAACHLRPRHGLAHERQCREVALARRWQVIPGRGDVPDWFGGQPPVGLGHRPGAVVEHGRGVELAAALDQPGHQPGPPGLM